MSARHIQNTASQATRTATALRNLADHSGIDRDDQGLLRKSAQILETLASAKSKAAKIAKKAEVEREAFVIKATKEAAALIASWPCDTLADQVALIRTHSSYAFAALSRDDGLGARSNIQYRLDDALRDIPSSLAYKAHGSGQPIAELAQAVRVEYELWRSAPIILQAAAKLHAEIDAAADALTKRRAA